MLPESLLLRSIEIALAIPDHSKRVRVLLALATRLPLETRERLLLRTLEVEREKIYPWEYSAALRKVIPLISDAERPYVIARTLEVVRNFDPGLEDFRAKELTKLAPLLSKQERPIILAEALDSVQNIDDLWRQSETLAEMARLLPEPECKDALDRALHAIKKIPNEHNRARALIGLLNTVTEPQKPKIIDEILEIALRIKNEEFLAPTLAGLAPYLSAEQLGQSIDAANRIYYPEYRAEAMVGLAFYAPHSLKLGTLKNAQDAANAISNTENQSQVLTALNYQATTLNNNDALEALNATLKISDGFWRAMALGALSQQLPDWMKNEALGKAYDSTRLPPRPDKLNEVRGEAARSWLPQLPESGEGLGDQLAKLSESEQISLMREAFDKMQTRVVNTSFVPRSQPTEQIEKNMPLQTGQLYYFCLDIGMPKLHLMEGISPPLPPMPSKTRLRIVLFSFKDGIKVISGAEVGELELQPDGFASVIRQPDCQFTIPSDPDLLKSILFFPVESPKKEGTFRLRCNIYYENILIQSRLIQALVMNNPQSTEGSLRFDIEYALSNSLWPAHLIEMQSHRLSIMLNGNDDGTHALFFMGEKDKIPFHSEALIPATELKTLIENARKAMRKAAWGSEDSWREGTKYLYEGKTCDTNRFRTDIINMAIRGYTLYDGIIDKLTGDASRSDELARIMRESGLVQIALQQSVTQVLPAALFYDYPLDTNPDHPHKLCETFVDAQKKNTPLEDTPCFQGDCPSYGKVDYVCPSGFWGYRHALGFPISVEADVPLEIILKGDPQIVVGVATNLNNLKEHMEKLKSMLFKTQSDAGWYYSSNRDTILKNLLKTKKPHLIYFYCHGGLDHNMPYLQVGSGEEYIDKSNLRAHGIYWDSPQPLVFINGCHTTDLDPEQTINLVEAFVRRGGVGVIGTEITIFEPLACSFAEECLRQFMVEKLSIGEAIRKSRLKLLKEGNPLGLVYTPFVLPSLHILEQSIGS